MICKKHFPDSNKTAAKTCYMTAVAAAAEFRAVVVKYVTSGNASKLCL